MRIFVLCLLLTAALLAGCVRQQATPPIVPEELTIEEEIILDYYYDETSKDFWMQYASDVLSLRFRGVFSDTYVVFVDGPFLYPSAETSEFVNGFLFQYPNGQTMLAYHQGIFYSLQEAYDLGFLTLADVMQLKANYIALGTDRSKKGEVPTERKPCTHMTPPPTGPSAPVSPSDPSTPTQPTRPNQSSNTVSAKEWLPDIPVITEPAPTPESLSLETLVYALYTRNASVENNAGIEESATIQAPAIVPFCDGAIEINEAIRQDYQRSIESLRFCYEYQYSLTIDRVHYTAILSDNILTVQIIEKRHRANPRYSFYFLDVSTGTRLSAYEVTQRYLPESYPAFLQRCTYNLLEYYKANPLDPSKYGSLTECLPNDAEVMQTYTLFPGQDGTLMITFYIPGSDLYYLLPYNEMDSHGWQSAEEDAYSWLFHLQPNEVYGPFEFGQLLAKSFFKDPQIFVQVLSREDSVAIIAISDYLREALFSPEDITHFTALCENIRDTADDPNVVETAQILLDHIRPL